MPRGDQLRNYWYINGASRDPRDILRQPAGYYPGCSIAGNYGLNPYAMNQYPAYGPWAGGQAPINRQWTNANPADSYTQWWNPNIGHRPLNHYQWNMRLRR